MTELFYKASIWLTVVFLWILATACIWRVAVNYHMPHYETITVTDKSVMPGNNERWLVYTDKEVYVINNLFWVGFFKSADVYNSIEKGKTYRVYVSGKRMPFLSFYKNVRKAFPVEET